MESGEITIILLDEKTIEQQVIVYRSAFETTSSIEDNLRKWRKKHYENPLGNSLIFGAFINGDLVGMNAYMPVAYYINGERVKMLQSCESGVLPNFQGKGIWKKVVTYALKYIKEETDYKLVMGFPNYINSYPGFKKMGWKTLTNMKNYVLINNLSAFKSVFRKKSFLFRFALNGLAIQRMLTHIYNNRKYHVEKIRLEDLIWNNKTFGVLSCDHSIELLKWKRDYKDLFSVCVKEGDEVLATCLYGLSTYNGSVIIKMENFEYCENYSDKSKSLLSSLIVYFSKKYPEASFVRVWAQDNSLQISLLKKLFFVESSHPNPFIISEPDTIYANIPWSLSFFDLD